MPDLERARKGWPLDPDTAEEDPNDTFGQALARAAERRAVSSSSPDDDWLTSGDTPSTTPARRGSRPPDHDDDWLSADDLPPDDSPAAPASRRNRLRPTPSDDDWSSADDAADGQDLSAPRVRRRGGVRSLAADDGWLSADDPALDDDGSPAASRRGGSKVRPPSPADGWVSADDPAPESGSSDNASDKGKANADAKAAPIARRDGPGPTADKAEDDPIAVLKRRLAAVSNGSSTADNTQRNQARNQTRSRGRSGSGSISGPGNRDGSTQDEPGRTGRRGRGARRDKQPPGHDPNPVAKAKDICLTLLTARARTRSELEQSLRRKEFADDVIDQVLGRLDEVGLIDDAAFADAWVQSRHTYQGLGRRALKAELHRKGVPDEVAAEAIASVDHEAEEQRARELVRKRLRAMSELDDTVKLRRLLGMLARKGYSQGLAYSVIKDELNSTG
ncbi:regulatory protein [Labedaea rhizosphaerae]|uniref:Regulatory protein RecX n=1 Tax=Labedaea rhizosphaerae TaxID=598644 RepID=A0A4R6RQV8_LABRH|nr:regulatory protein [Labedaea rhizosphaerae]